MSTTTTASVPLETERQARELPAVRAVYEAFRAAPGVGRMQPRNLAMLDEAAPPPASTLGAYDRRILAWLAGWEPQTCAVIAGLITRARGREGGGVMALRITDELMTSTVTGHRAECRADAAAGGRGAWVCTRLPARLLTKAEAMMALDLAEAEAAGGGESERAAGFRAGLGIR